ncbi:hypothetical protein GCM10009557_12360 [Virgisporangium ochraceum]|uniref:Uncharacterized protein n=1 Tax=Virgisporangium ochraceum TaxID=65505 RepID=A0A8J4A9F4_9ACTN|nr:DUF6000 family protein [Virgisporangium ochraceum]GIJ75426.1 hypothetical protein Voc01_103430 [Virgisporangium ochraceum]
MRPIQSDPELTAAVDRYVRPGRRYMALHGARFLRFSDDERNKFVRSLRAAAAEITLRELIVLLEGDYRARLTAAFLAGIGRRARLRDLIGANLLDSEFVYAGQGYCFALASFGTPADAALLVRYLDRYLPQPDLRYDQPWAVGALLHLDDRLGTADAERFLTEGGLWQTWAAETHGNPENPHDCRRLIDDLCALAIEFPEGVDAQ